MDQNQSASKLEQVRNMRDRTVPVERQQEYWTDDELQQLESMFYEGIGITDMALTLHRSEMAVINRIKGYYRRVRAPRQTTKECLCRKCPYCIEGVCTWRGKNCPPDSQLT